MTAAIVDALYEEGRREWPDLALERATFEHFAKERIDAADPQPPHFDLFLACACSHGEPNALAVFERSYLSQLPMFLSGVTTNAQVVDEVRQVLRERLFVDGKIRQYNGRGKLKSWLRVVAVRAALDAREPDVTTDDEIDVLPAPTIDPELAVIRERYRAEFNQALRDALAALSPEQRSLLRLHYVDGLNIGKIATVFGVSRATIGRRVLELRESIFADVVDALHARLGATPEELDSLLRVVRSGLAISLSSILKA